MDAAESFEDHETSVLNELLEARDKEEIRQEHCLALVQFPAGRFKVEVYV